MKNLIEQYTDTFVSKEIFNAEDSKPFKFAVCVTVNEVDNNQYLIIAQAAKLPKYLSKKHKESVASCSGLTIKELSVLDVSEYGLSAPLDNWLVKEDEIESKLTEVDKMIGIYGSMCGFYFDKQVNRIGNNGWDFLNGRIG